MYILYVVYIFPDALSASVHSLMGFSMNSKAENTVNMISMYFLLHAAQNAVSLISFDLRKLIIFNFYQI